ncbi:sialin-like [Mercenaria mercenaria]|uniref:sialin-like n=1 Tax=Mercenaria mercenaria TaxID=6596 RepID=UPI00234EA41A|nr:sialin-like [Mercenaria mercenaria]
MNLYALRVNMSVAIVCMTRSETSKTCNFTGGNVSRSNTTVECDLPEVSNQDDRFDLDKKTQGLILGSFFLGYALTQLPGGWLAGRYGGKKLCGWSMFACAVATLLTPLAARTSAGVLICIRVVTGLCQCLSGLVRHT